MKAIIKRLKSYFKKEWNFEDYPIRTWKNPNAGEINVNYGAGIVNWSMMVGHGETPDLAKKALSDSFKLYKENNENLPRPGCKVPIQFASTEEIDKYEKTAIDFFEKVLELDYYDGFYSDGSCFACMEPYDSDEKAKKFREEVINRTLLHYNTDISDVYDEEFKTSTANSASHFMRGDGILKHFYYF
jgi:hypothetical protein